MVRVKFMESTKSYAKGACVYLQDDEAASAIRAGHGVRIDDPPVLGDGDNRATPMQRILFVNNWDAKQELPNGMPMRFAKGERVFVPETIAKRAIGAGAAEDYPFAGTDEDKSIAGPPADKMSRPVKVKA